MKNYSLRKSLIKWIGIPIIIAAILTLLISFISVNHEIEEVYDSQMVQSAKILLQLTESGIVKYKDLTRSLDDDILKHHYEKKMGFRIWVDDILVLQSKSTKHFNGFEAEPGFSDQQFYNKNWRFFVFIDPKSKIKIEISELYEIRYELIWELMGSLLFPSLLFVPLILFIIWIGVRKLLRPVIEISNQVDKRSADDLSAIEKEILPQEILPLVSALNKLFTRISDSLKRERQFTDYAAHELRTPLAAIKTQAQVLMRKNKSEAEFKMGLQNLDDSINRATRLVEQLLYFARLQNDELLKTNMNLSACLNGVIEGLAIKIHEKNIELKLDIEQDIKIYGNFAAISILLGNLIDNAIKYTKKEGYVAISLKQNGNMVIEDNGLGLSDEDKQKVFERFVRVDKTDQIGSGLGLSIADFIASLHNVEIKLFDNEPTGLRVFINWDILNMIS